MTFNELLTEVYALTNRPDLVAESKAAIKAATIKAHQSDYYAKDLYETGIQFDESNLRQSLDYPSIITNYRTLSYVRRVVDENDADGQPFTVVTPAELMDSYGYNRTDIAYVAGRVLELRSSVAFTKILLGCYVTPIVTEAAYSSWVAELQPYAIIYEACRVIFTTIGYQEQSASYRALVTEEHDMLKMLGIADVGL